jgi:hypothetical protein
MTFPSVCPGYHHSNNICQARDARRITAVDMKCVRKTAGYAWTEYKTNTNTADELNITLVLDRIQKKLIATYKQHVS